MRKYSAGNVLMSLWENRLLLNVCSLCVCRAEGDDGAAGEEEAGGEGQADALGGVPGEEERQEEAEEISKKTGE